MDDTREQVLVYLTVDVVEILTDTMQQLARCANALERMANAAESQGTPDLAAMSASIFGGLGDALAAAQQEGPTEDG